MDHIEVDSGEVGGGQWTVVEMLSRRRRREVGRFHDPETAIRLALDLSARDPARRYRVVMQPVPKYDTRDDVYNAAVLYARRTGLPVPDDLVYVPGRRLPVARLGLALLLFSIGVTAAMLLVVLLARL